MNPRQCDDLDYIHFLNDRDLQLLSPCATLGAIPPTAVSFHFGPEGFLMSR